MELTHPKTRSDLWHLAEGDVGVPREELRGGTVKDLYELKGEGTSIRGIARDAGHLAELGPQVPEVLE